MIPDPRDVISSFWQDGESDCTTIATIKTAIATYGVDAVFTAKDNGDKTWSITFKDQSTLNVADADIIRVQSLSGFRPAQNPYAKAQDIFKYALFCFGVFVANYAKLNGCGFATAAGMIDSGINVAQDVAHPSYRYLGLPDSIVQALVPLDGDGTADVTSLAANKAYLMWNVYHAVFAADDVFDNYGDPLTTARFVAKHHSLFRGRQVWAVRFK